MANRLLLPVLLPALLLAGTSAAQDSDRQARYVEQRATKLAKPFLKNAEWYLDYHEARAAAKQQGKFLLTYFTRSYSP